MQALKAAQCSKLEKFLQHQSDVPAIKASAKCLPYNRKSSRHAKKSCCSAGLRLRGSSDTLSWFGQRVRVCNGSVRSDRQRGKIVCEDRRIRWDSEDEGWVGGGNFLERGEDDRSPINSQLIPLLLDRSETHYKFLGLLPSADIEAVRSAFRKLAPVYHPDTSTLPKDVAEEKFVRLREAYEVLSDESRRRMYDWQLALQARDGDMDFVWPYEADRGQWAARGPGQKPMKPGDADRDWMDGKTVDLSPQSKYALMFDLFAFFVAICTATFVLVFKNPAPS